MDDVAACRVIKEAVGPGLRGDVRPHRPPARRRGPEGLGLRDRPEGGTRAPGGRSRWLEEPFARDDYRSPARLAAEIDLPITGGEGYVGLDGFRECVTHKTYDILQPEGSRVAEASSPA